MAHQLPTPAPSPPPAVPTPTLPAQINAATRKEHIVLNRLIVDRLALALPPHASDPALLGQGLAAFAQIYYMFEGVWQEVFDSDELDQSLSGEHDVQIRQWLATLRPKGLARSLRLRNDLKHISHRTRTSIYPQVSGQKRIMERTGNDIRAKPHILLAYSWVMYMAIFSGGRWIRQQLANAGVEYWTGNSESGHVDKQETSLVELSGFSFLSFEGEHDGEDIKALFKARLAEAEALLTPHERQEAVLAAKQLFEDCISLVGMLDRAVWRQRIYDKLPVVALCVVAVLFIMWLFW